MRHVGSHVGMRMCHIQSSCIQGQLSTALPGNLCNASQRLRLDQQELPRPLTCAMIVRSCSWKPRTASVLGPWRILSVVRTKRWASQHLGKASGSVNHHRSRANPWNPVPYQWAPLPETGQDLTDGALQRKDYGKFVQFFRQASPYIEGHRGRTFVVVIPGEVWSQFSVSACHA